MHPPQPSALLPGHHGRCGWVVSQAPGWAPCQPFSFGLKDCRTSRGFREDPLLATVLYATVRRVYVSQDNARSMRSWFYPRWSLPMESSMTPGLVCGLALDYRAGPGPTALAWEPAGAGDQLHMGPTSRHPLPGLKLFPLDSNSFLNLSFSCSLG